MVKAKAQSGLDDLKARLVAGDIRAIRPFGKALDHSLQNICVDADGTLLFEQDEGWRRIETLPRLWEVQRS